MTSLKKIKRSGRFLNIFLVQWLVSQTTQVHVGACLFVCEGVTDCVSDSSHPPTPPTPSAVCSVAMGHFCWCVEPAGLVLQRCRVASIKASRQRSTRAMTDTRTTRMPHRERQRGRLPCGPSMAETLKREYPLCR